MIDDRPKTISNPMLPFGLKKQLVTGLFKTGFTTWFTFGSINRFKPVWFEYRNPGFGFLETEHSSTQV